MKVLWISDYGNDHQGGAQRSNSLVIDEGIRRGHSIAEFNVGSDDGILHPEYDLLVSSNLEALYHKPRIIEWITTFPKHVRLEHDANRYLSQKDREALFTSCKKAFFLSNFHLKQFVDSYGDYFINTDIIPDPIDSLLFKNQDLEREDKILYVGNMHQLKGTNSLFSYAIENPEEEFVVAGWSQDPYFIQTCHTIPNIDFIGNVRFEEMPNLYNKYKKLFYTPAFYEPYCRSVAEAIFCGMEIISNDLIGCLHHMEEVGRDEMVSQCSKAPESFWESVECL